MNLIKEITFFIRDERHTVDASTVSPETTLNSYLRNKLHFTGTKRMCNEGGCGVCIVAVCRQNPITNQLETFAINSCLVSIFSCYNWHIYTIESIGNQFLKHPLQNVLANFNGTQCGYCTPGMIMNMYALNEQMENRPSMQQVDNSFGGNICRCTGYRPILSAFKSVCQDASEELLGKHDVLTDIEELSKLKKCDFKCLSTFNKAPFYFKFNNNSYSWIKVYEFKDLMQVIKTLCNAHNYMLVAGNTAKGVYKPKSSPEIYVDVLDIQDLNKHEHFLNKLVLGANISLTTAMEIFSKISKSHPEGFSYLMKLTDHIDLIANVPVRNVGSLAGNLMIKHKNIEFPSDVFLILECVGAKLEIVDVMNDKTDSYSLKDFLKVNMKAKIIKSIILFPLNNSFKFESYKIMPRAQNAHALVNAAFLLKINNEGNKVDSASITFGCINPNFIHATRTESFVVGKNLFQNNVLQSTFQHLDQELEPDFVQPDPQPAFRKQLAIALFYKFILSIAPKHLMHNVYVSGGTKLVRPVSRGTQDYQTNESLYPLTKAISKIEAVAQTTGEATYISDMPDLPGQLHAAFVLAKASPNSNILKISVEKALKLEGVVAYFDKHNIPGRNTFTPIEAAYMQIEEELFCSGIVKYFDQPLGIIVAKTPELAETAAEMIIVTYKKPDQSPCISIKDILSNNDQSKITQDKIIEAKKRGKNVKNIIRGTFDLNWQYHFHMETQCCNVVPTEDGLDMFPSSQWMDLSQISASVVLGIPANKINVSVRRIGGAFGAKLIRNAQISSATALAAYKLQKPVKMWLPLQTNMSIIGKRYPLSSTYEIGTDSNGQIQYLNNNFYYDYGAGGNEAVLSLLFETYLETYNTETWYSNASITHTDMHPSCFIRAPGSAEGLAMAESIMEHGAMASHIDPLEFRIKNISNAHPKLLEHIYDLKKWANIDQRKQHIRQFNSEHRWKKRALSVVPMVYPFGIFFNYNVIVSIYNSDGSVAIAHGGVEIGQGINSKVAQVCAYKLGIPMDQISVKPSNNLIAPNASMTGGSTTSELVCFGIIKACDVLLERMAAVKQRMTNPTWPELVKQCFKDFVNLSVVAMASPKDEELKSYSVYGVCASEVEVDILTGQHQVNRVDLLEDVGNSMSPEIDIGQIEGAFIMSLGYFTCEQIVTSREGEILTNRTWNYKPPGVKDIPVDFRVKIIHDNPNEVGVLKSKAVSEPPFCLGVSIPLAIRNAVASARTESGATSDSWYSMDGPSTVENTFQNSLHDSKQYLL